MTELLSLKNVKKRDWAVAAALAFALSLAFVLFENGGLSAAARPVFLRLALCGAWFFCAVGLIFALDRPWVPLTAAALGAAGCFAAASAYRDLLLFVLLPASLLCWLFRYFSPRGRETRRIFPLWAAACVLFAAAAAFLAVRVAGLAMVSGFFLPKTNRLFWGVLAFLSLIAADAALCFVGAARDRRSGEDRTKKTEKTARKKKSGKARGGEKNADPGFSGLLCCAPLLLYACCVCICWASLWHGGALAFPYALFGVLAALFVSFAVIRQRDETAND